MSNASESASLEDGDESILFNDGFSVVDDINTPLESMAVDETPKQPDGDGNKSSEGGIENEEDSTEVTEEENFVKDEGEEKKNDISERSESETLEDKSEVNMSPKKTPSNSSLMINNDVDLGSDENSTKTDKPTDKEPKEKEATTKEESSSLVVKKAAALRKKNDASFVWVSNITKQIKASSLKKHFAECGKVSTAKVVTNGKVFFGYVEFEVAEHANTCIKTMNNTLIEGRKIQVTRNRPDVTKKSIVTPKKNEKKDDLAKIETKTTKKPEPVVVEVVKDTPKVDEEKKKKDEEEKKDEKEKPKTDAKESKPKKKETKSSDDKKATPNNVDETKKTDAKKTDRSKEPQRSRSADRAARVEQELRRKVSDNLKKIARLRNDLDRTQIEANNLRRRLANEQRRTKAEELRGEKYKSEARTLSDQLKQTRADYEKETQRLVKKHKAELEKAATYQRESNARKEEELKRGRDELKRRQDEFKRRQEDFEKEVKVLEEAKRALEHNMKRARKSRSPSPPPLKRYRGRDDGYPERKITPPPPKLSVEVRSKNERVAPPPYYDDKKTKGIYNRLGDYAAVDKEHYVKETTSNGRHRSSGYAGDVDVPKGHWNATSPEWKKPTSSPPDWKKPTSSPPDWKKPTSSSGFSDWKKSTSGSSDWKKPPSSSSSDWKTSGSSSMDWKKSSSGTSDWKSPASNPLDWKKPSTGSSDWKSSTSSSMDWKSKSMDWKAPIGSSMDWKKPSSTSSPDWKMPSSSSSMPKAYLERFGSSQADYPMSSPFFSSGPGYFKHGQFESSRKH